MVIGESRIVKALGLAVPDTVVTQLEERAERRPVFSQKALFIHCLEEMVCASAELGLVILVVLGLFLY